MELEDCLLRVEAVARQVPDTQTRKLARLYDVQILLMKEQRMIEQEKYKTQEKDLQIANLKLQLANSDSTLQLHLANESIRKQKRNYLQRNLSLTKELHPSNPQKYTQWERLCGFKFLFEELTLHFVRSTPEAKKDGVGEADSPAPPPSSNLRLYWQMPQVRHAFFSRPGHGICFYYCAVNAFASKKK